MKKTSIKDNLTSSDEDDQMTDEDTCNDIELNKLFKINYNICHEESISLTKNYILHLTSTNKFDKFIAGISNQSIAIYDIGDNSFTNVTPKSENYGKYNSHICGLKFLNNDSNLFLCGTTKGKVYFNDLRMTETICTFEDDTSEGVIKKISSFDLNNNNRVLCAGTPRIQNDVYLLFFDLRKRALLGGYWDSHSDDVTQIKFHPTKSDIFASGSTDGLINIFDISQTNEDDAMLNCLNTENSVDNLNWHKNVYEKDFLSCITHTNDLHIYNVEESEMFVDFDRANLTKAIRKKSGDGSNLINCHNTNADEILILAQSNYNKGKCVRTLKVENKTLVPSGKFNENKQILRCSLFNEPNNAFIVGGESGIITLYTGTESSLDNENHSELNNSLKTKCKVNEKKRNKPY